MPEPKAQRNFTDPDSRIMLSKPDGWIYGYNAQLVVDEAHQVIVATSLETSATDAAHLPALTDQVEANTRRRPATVLADAGYQSDENHDDDRHAHRGGGGHPGLPCRPQAGRSAPKPIP